MTLYDRKGSNFYIQRGWTGPYTVRVPTDEYGRTRDNIVLACVDIIIVGPDGKFLLPHRRIEPAKGYWVIGGRMNPGETEAEAANRLFTYDTGLFLSLERFIYLGRFHTVFAAREEPPQHHGTHTVNFTFVVFLTRAELDQMRPNTSEYEGRAAWRWFTKVEITKAVAADELHPELGDIAKKIRSWRWRIGWRLRRLFGT